MWEPCDLGGHLGALRILSLGSREEPAVEFPELIGGVSEFENMRSIQISNGKRVLNWQKWKPIPLVGQMPD